MNRIIDKSQWKQVVQDRLSTGISIKRISQELGCCYFTLTAFIRKNFELPEGRIGIRFRALMLKDKLTELAGLSYGCQDIGPKLGISPATAMRYLKLLNIPFSRNNRFVFRYDTSTWHNDVVKWYRAGISRDVIAKRKKVSVPTIQRFLKNNGYVINGKRSKADYA